MARSRTTLLAALATAAWALALVTPATAALPKGDIVFVLDESGSMAEEIADVRDNVSLIAAQASDRIDARYALVGYGGGSPGVAPNLPFTRTDFTNAAGLKTALRFSGAFRGNGGGLEMGLDATTYSMTQVTGFREDAAACVVLVSDEPPFFRVDEATDMQSATAALRDRNATWFGVVSTTHAVVRRTYGPERPSLAAVTDGAVFSITRFRRDASLVLSALARHCVRSVEEAQPAIKLRCTMKGTSRRDVLVGTPGRDVICGFGGNDIIRGLAGNDTIYGGGGHDILRGQRGADLLIGGSGDDLLTGGAGQDALHGQRGRDHLSGGAGNDWVSGGDGRDRLWARDGRRDRLHGGRGFDVGYVDLHLDRVFSIERQAASPLRR